MHSPILRIPSLNSNDPGGGVVHVGEQRPVVPPSQMDKNNKWKWLDGIMSGMAEDSYSPDPNLRPMPGFPAPHHVAEWHVPNERARSSTNMKPGAVHLESSVQESSSTMDRSQHASSASNIKTKDLRNLIPLDLSCGIDHHISPSVVPFLPRFRPRYPTGEDPSIRYLGREDGNADMTAKRSRGQTKDISVSTHNFGLDRSRVPSNALPAEGTGKKTATRAKVGMNENDAWKAFVSSEFDDDVAATGAGPDNVPDALLSEMEISASHNATLGSDLTRSSGYFRYGVPISTTLDLADPASPTVEPSLPSASEERYSLRFTAPRPFIGKLAAREDLPMPLGVLHPNIQRIGRRGKPRSAKAGDPRADIRGVPNYDGDPIEECDDIVSWQGPPFSLFGSLETE